MKKSFSIITMLLIAFIAFNVTAQTYDIIGTWEGSSSIGSGSEWTIVSLEGDNMTILEKGNEYNLTRVK